MASLAASQPGPEDASRLSRGAPADDPDNETTEGNITIEGLSVQGRMVALYHVEGRELGGQGSIEDEQVLALTHEFAAPC